MLERVLPWLGSFADQRVLITGASSGIGRETALTFARQGAAVALAARRRSLLDDVADEVNAAGGRALVVPTDVADAGAAREAVEAVRRAWGGIDVLVNSAGILIPAAVEDLSVADLEAMLRVNVYGTLLMMQAVLPLMRRQEQGTIINIASLAGRRGITPLGGYCASKFALVGLSEALRVELGGTNIHVGLVLPGVIDTPMAEGYHQNPSLPSWPAVLNMPPQWVVAAVLLAVRFRLREIAVPPGAATMELIGAMTPGLTDALIRWGTAAARLMAGRPSSSRAPGPAAAGKRAKGKVRPRPTRRR